MNTEHKLRCFLFNADQAVALPNALTTTLR